VFHPGIGSGKHERLVAVVVPDEIGRFAVLSVDLHDLGGGLVHSDHPALNV
jgi:hypothetical protein